MGVVRKTRLVSLMLGKFNHTNQAISLATLVEDLQSEMNKTSVYRILERLESDGTLHSFVGHDGARWYSKFHECASLQQKGIHHHFQCNDCGKTECIAMDIPMPKLKKHHIDTVSILITGTCDQCLCCDTQ